MDDEGIEDDIPSEEGLLIDALSQDGPESNLLTDALGEDATEDPVDAPVGNDSKPEDFVIENGVLVEYKGKGGAVVIPNGVTSIGE